MRTTLDSQDDVLAARPKLVTNEQIDQLRDRCASAAPWLADSSWVGPAAFTSLKISGGRFLEALIKILCPHRLNLDVRHDHSKPKNSP